MKITSVFGGLLLWVSLLGHASIVKLEELAELTQDFNRIVYPENISYGKKSNYSLKLSFQICDGQNIYQFNLQTRRTILQDDDPCQLEGFVFFKQGIQKVQLAVCNGILGTVCTNSTRSIVIRPLLKDDDDYIVTLNMLATTPHVIMAINSEDTLPVYTDFNFFDVIPGVFNTASKKPKIMSVPHSESSVSVRKARNAQNQFATMVAFNRAASMVYMYYMNPTTHIRSYFIRLRLNEKNFIRSYVGTTWLAYDENQQPLLLNKRYNLLILPKHLNDNFDVIITQKQKVTDEMRQKNMNEKLSPRYLEVFIVADQSFLKKHKSHQVARKYIGALIEGVNILFAHKSLNTSFHVVIKKIQFLDDNTKVNIPKTEPKKALQNACKFLYDEKKKMNHKFDFGIFLTRTKFGYSGFTPLYRMCVEYKSCTLIYDSGLPSSFIIAHEIGHGIGLAHDGDHNKCGEDIPRGSIMAPTVHSRFDRYHWSKCSKTQIRENLDYFPCLKNKPSNFKFDKKALPGKTFNIDEQCEYLFGRGYTGCLGKRESNQYCTYLFCRIPNRKNRCSYFSLPPADGTKCGPDEWCVGGKCLPTGRLTPSPIDGMWSEWSEWGSCSSQCGQGVRLRNRVCDNPRSPKIWCCGLSDQERICSPKTLRWYYEHSHAKTSARFGGKACVGLKREWKLCNDKVCRINHVFDDKRSDACYHLHRKGWSWFSKESIYQKVRDANMDCQFENGFGAWDNSNKTKYKWLLHKGTTPTPKTGPLVDHTFGNASGKYIFFESSWPLRKGDRVLLVSPNILVPHLCFTLYYHMKGERVGTLRILKLSSNESVVDELWTRTGSSGPSWYQLQLNISHHKQYKIGIEAIRGSTYLSDIAVDDINIVLGKCVQDPEEACKLYCKNPQHNYLQIYKPVPNGLKCNGNSSNICVDGKCQMLGCDGKVGSTKQFDSCGICGGDNKSCSFQQINMNVRPDKLSQLVFIIPEGSVGFTITKISTSEYKLALQDIKRKAVYYYDRPPPNYKWSYFSINKSTLRYQTFPNKTEKAFIEITKRSKVEVQLISPGGSSLKQQQQQQQQREVISLKYSFYISNALTYDVFTWMLNGWSKCNAFCNGGNTTSSYKCFNVRTNKTVDSTMCSSKVVEIVNVTKPCNTHTCKVSYGYLVGKWSRCSICGRIGNKTRSVRCMKTKESEKPIEADETFCVSKRKPPITIKCYRYCPKRSVCVERSRACAGLVKKGYCSYKTVQTLCCMSCQPKQTNERKKLQSI